VGRVVAGGRGRSEHCGLWLARKELERREERKKGGHREVGRSWGSETVGWRGEDEPDVRTCR
jgi:hypothetical protein